MFPASACSRRAGGAEQCVSDLLRGQFKPAMVASCRQSQEQSQSLFLESFFTVCKSPGAGGLVQIRFDSPQEQGPGLCISARLLGWPVSRLRGLLCTEAVCPSEDCASEQRGLVPRTRPTVGPDTWVLRNWGAGLLCSCHLPRTSLGSLTTSSPSY